MTQVCVVVQAADLCLVCFVVGGRGLDTEFSVPIAGSSALNYCSSYERTSTQVTSPERSSEDSQKDEVVSGEMKSA